MSNRGIQWGILILVVAFLSILGNKALHLRHFNLFVLILSFISLGATLAINRFSERHKTE